MFVRYDSVLACTSHLTRGAWIEICLFATILFLHVRRTSHEVRGLKYSSAYQAGQGNGSHLTRGAWIEIFLHTINFRCTVKSHLTRGAWIEMAKDISIEAMDSTSHLTRGAWIEIKQLTQIAKEYGGRTSHEVRGLKYEPDKRRDEDNVSHLTRGAWIEMISSYFTK